MMFERITVDQFAEAIEEQVLGARPQARLVRRFFRSGKRDGRKGRDPQDQRRFIERGVGVASNRIAEAYQAEQVSLSAQAESLTAREGALATSVPTPTPVQGEASTDDLSHALAVLRSQREEAAEATRKQERDSLSQQVTEIQTRLAALRAQYRQRVITAHEVGGVFWARYCTGFAYGLRGWCRRIALRLSRARSELGSASIEAELDRSITFAMPVVLEESAG
jgi:hypothetical protein